MFKHGNLKSRIIDVIRCVLLVQIFSGEQGVRSFSFAPYRSSYREAGIWTRPEYAIGNGVNIQRQKHQNTNKFGLDSSTRLLHSNVNLGIEEEEKEKNNLSSSKRNKSFKATIPKTDTDRRAFLTALAAIPIGIALAPPQEADAFFPFQKSSGLSVLANTNATAASAIRQPNMQGTMFKDGLGTESCLLKLLPVRKPVFRKLENKVLDVTDEISVDFRLLDESSSGDTVERAFEEVIVNVNSTIVFLDSQRNNLQPFFNIDDPTVFFIRKAERGEYLAEALRNELVNIKINAEKANKAGVLESQKQALRKLAELGELLVEKFPYDVPSEGKFSYLPRLAGRAKVTFTIARPSNKKRGLGFSDKDKILGNVTILADGFAAPITAGNFVDLSVRNFYTGLPVKNIQKRLGVDATLTMTEDNTVAYDIANTVVRLEDRLAIFKRAINKDDDDNDGNDNDATIFPIMGSYREGFYDPLTAKPRKLPLEIVQFDSFLGRAKLSYESAFTTTVNSTLVSSGKGEATNLPLKSQAKSEILPSATSDRVADATSKAAAMITETTTALKKSVNPARTGPILTFDIPGLVAMNHPDKNLNGASSEFFCLTDKELKSERATSLLNKQYAPFGYVIEGLDIMKNLDGGDVITATFVNEWGQLNLKKIRGTSFADALAAEDV